MRAITLLQPKRIAFGDGCAQGCVDDLLALGARRVFLVSSPPLLGAAQPLIDGLGRGGAAVEVFSAVTGEPTVATLEQALAAARPFAPDAVVGLGGGSCLDVAKLVAALHDGDQDVRQAFGINLLRPRRTHLACLPTTAGTGSEVSTNAILLHEEERLKKGVVSPHLVPDTAYVDPLLTLSAPPALTATTGMDALAHCVEEYGNRNAHATIDLYAFEGIRLIGANLERAFAQGDDVEARGAMALASLYGGLGLGNVGTNGVHALAYPLGGAFRVPHGAANSLLLPHVMAFNLVAQPERFAAIAVALGAQPGASDRQTAERGVERVRQLAGRLGIATRLSQLGIEESAIPDMARAAMSVTRLLKNNPREITLPDAEAIYRAAF